MYARQPKFRAVLSRLAAVLLFAVTAAAACTDVDGRPRRDAALDEDGGGTAGTDGSMTLDGPVDRATGDATPVDSRTADGGTVADVRVDGAVISVDAARDTLTAADLAPVDVSLMLPVDMAVPVDMAAPGVARLTISPRPVDFGDVTVGASDTRTVTVKNEGTADSGAVTVAISGTHAAQFAAAGTCSGTVLPPGGSCTVMTTFSPTGTGDRTATLTATASPGGAAATTLNGTGRSAADLSFVNANESFGTVDVGESTTRMITLRNTGQSRSGPLAAAALMGATLSPATGSTCQAGNTLAGGASCIYVVRFSPGTPGPHTGTLSVSASPGGTASVNLAGVGRVTYALTVLRGGTGSGTITSDPAGISCGTDCAQAYGVTGAVPSVVLQATAAAGSRFTGWGGACSGTGTCTLAMSADRYVEANFTAQPTLTVTIAGNGTVTTTSTPTQAAQINCPGTCVVGFDPNAMVTLTATPAAGATFVNWSAQCGGAIVPTCQLTMADARMVTANFGTTATSGLLATWTLNGSLNSDTPLAASSTAPNVTASALTKGSGLTAVTSTDAFVADAWSSALPEPTKYIEVSVTPPPGKTITYESVRFSLYSPSGGGGGFQLRSSLDGYSSWIDNQAFSGGLTGGGMAVTADAKMIGTQSGTVTFRVFLYNNTGDVTPLLRGFRGSAAGGTDLKVFGVVN